jgi:septum formation protein
MSQDADLVLASGSPRRRELLAALGLRFKVVPADIDEAPELKEAPEALVERLSLLKAEAVKVNHSQALVVAADTVVVLEGEILNKPRDERENHDFLARLSGRVHLVHTGHASLFRGRVKVSVVTTAVRFRRLSARELDWYVATGEGFDKAGGYGIQGRGAALVSRVEGCYFNVVGLSVAQVIEDARALGAELV